MLGSAARPPRRGEGGGLRDVDPPVRDDVVVAFLRLSGFFALATERMPSGSRALGRLAVTIGLWVLSAFLVNDVVCMRSRPRPRPDPSPEAPADPDLVGLATARTSDRSRRSREIPEHHHRIALGDLLFTVRRQARADRGHWPRPDVLIVSSSIEGLSIGPWKRPRPTTRRSSGPRG